LIVGVDGQSLGICKRLLSVIGFHKIKSGKDFDSDSSCEESSSFCRRRIIGKSAKRSGRNFGGPSYARVSIAVLVSADVAELSVTGLIALFRSVSRVVMKKFVVQAWATTDGRTLTHFSASAFVASPL
jgi:hypothetical protein